MFANWCFSLRNIGETLIGAVAIVFVGAKWMEGRTILSVAFDRLDKSQVIVKGPDEENVVWLGQRYGTKLEAEAVADAFSNRLAED